MSALDVPDPAFPDPKDADQAVLDPAVTDPAPATGSRRPVWQYALRGLGLVVVATVVVLVLRDKLPSPADIWGALRRADWRWVGAAFLLQGASIGMMIRQQRALLRAFGVQVPFRRVYAITYSSTALTMSLPAGGAVGAGFSYKQYRANGASAVTAGAVLLLSGLLSVFALVLLYLTGLALTASVRVANIGGEHPALAVALGAVVIGAIVVAAVWLSRRSGHVAPTPPPTPRLDRWSARRPRSGELLRTLLTTGRRAGLVKPRAWRFVLLTSTLNWALDLACLWASCRAVGIEITPFRLGLIYLGIQLVRQIPLTPGGIGVIEASLLAALVAAGAAHAPAGAAVLIYRLFSAWLIVPIGFVMLAILRRRPPRILLDGSPASSPAPDDVPGSSALAKDRPGSTSASAEIPAAAG